MSLNATIAQVTDRIRIRSEPLRHRYLDRMTTATPKRPRDPNQLAKLIADIATGECSDGKPPMGPQERGRLGGKKGGAARAKNLSAEERSEAARKAASARWAQGSPKAVPK